MNSSISMSLQEQQVLADALDDEYRSHATYQEVISSLGPVRPFANIVEAEARHTEALFAEYAVPPPINRWAGKAPRLASGHDACEAGVQGEIDKVAVYDRLLRATQRSDLLDGFRALRSASQDRNLRAFERWVQRG